MITQNIDLSIIIVNWNTRQLLLNCLSSIYDTVRKAAFEIIVVDNGSTDGSVEAISKMFPLIKVIANPSNHGFARANNVAMKQMKGKYAVLLNSDTILKENALDDMLRFMEQHTTAGICGPQLLNKDGSKQNSVGVFPSLLTEFVSKGLIHVLSPSMYERHFQSKKATLTEPTVVDFIIGACMMVRKAAMDKVGMFDEDYFFLYEEVDWCYRMRKAGWLVYHLPDVEIYHLGGQSMKEINLRARAETWRSRYLFFEKSLKLSIHARYGLLFMGILQNVYQFMVYTLLNLLTLFAFRRMRRRWLMFAYLMVWHVRGRPVDMGIPR